ncbi:N-acetylglucosamine kinase [Streptomyces sp. AC555_RSS877]|uniref:N-acetylglucosamine kinase n=1 Tax=Streptomyces sp. AC555_RSS877 TaxID=2823688 RepID=UPI001C27F9B9|nr:BadF/BadG/BcrA/BcrD ATPase family protein [Streptomyces sp. AC555_RSS877]
MGNDLNQKWDGELVVGLDAGGTRTRVVLAAAADGRPLGEGAAGPGNALTVPVPRLTEHLAEAVARAVPEKTRGRVVSVAGGFAGATAASPDDPGHVHARTALTAALRRLGIPAASVTICSDIEAAFAAAPGTPADGLALVAGTGAVAMRITGRRCAVTVDGDGWLLGDDGSGFWIGRTAVRAALRMADGRGPATALAGSVGRRLGLPDSVLPYGSAAGRVVPRDGGPGSVVPRDGGPGRVLPHDGGPGGPLPFGGEAGWSRPQREAYRMHLLPAVMADAPIRLARLAPLVAEAARDKDAVAEAILREAAGQLAETVRALYPQPGEPLVATGGLLGPDGPLTTLLAGRLTPLGLTLDWVADGCRGAVALARLAHGGAG